MKHASFGMEPTTGQTHVTTSNDFQRLKSSKFKIENSNVNTSGNFNEILAQDSVSARNLAMFLE